jgi:hypothetical protein
LEHLEREWVHLLKRPIFYVNLVKARDHLEGWDFVVAANPPQECTADLVGRMSGPTARARLLYLLDDMHVDWSNLPELNI